MGKLSKYDEKRLAFFQQAERYRDAADEDYITARGAYRNNLPCAFLTSAHQCVEKYLKSILLFNQLSTKEFSHDLTELIEKIDDKLKFVLADIPEGYIKFIREYLNHQGFNRYLDKPLAFGMWGRSSPELLALDWAVWYLRRFSKNLFYGYICGRELSEKEQREMYKESFDRELLYLTSSSLRASPHKYKISQGFLEKVLGDKGYHHARSMLIWKNPCFGGRSRKRLRNYPINSKFMAGREELAGFDLVRDEIKGPWNVKQKSKKAHAKVA